MKNAILVTGAGGGIGTAIVKHFAAHSDLTVIATDKFDIGLEKFKHSNNILAYTVDITSSDSLDILKKNIETQGLQIQILINNAGVIAFFPLSEASTEELKSIFEVNTFGALNVIRTFLSHLIATKGRVIQISSESSKLMGPFQPYNASKLALDALTSSIRCELQLKDIELVSIKPGAIATPLLQAMSQAELPNPDSLYKKEFAAFALMLSKIKIKNIPPERLAALVFKAATCRSPRLVYKINNNPLITLMYYLGEGINSRLMTWQLRKNMRS